MKCRSLVTVAVYGKGGSQQRSEGKEANDLKVDELRSRLL
jgi:hypothetical protein